MLTNGAQLSLSRASSNAPSCSTVLPIVMKLVQFQAQTFRLDVKVAGFIVLT